MAEPADVLGIVLQSLGIGVDSTGIAVRGLGTGFDVQSLGTFLKSLIVVVKSLCIVFQSCGTIDTGYNSALSNLPGLLGLPQNVLDLLPVLCILALPEENNQKV